MTFCSNFYENFSSLFSALLKESLQTCFSMTIPVVKSIKEVIEPRALNTLFLLSDEGRA